MKDWKPLKFWAVLIVLTALLVFGLYPFVVSHLFPWEIDNGRLTFTERGQFGDSFGALNAFVSALAFAGLIYTIRQQEKQLIKQSEQMDQQYAMLELQKNQLKIQQQELSDTRAEMKLQTQELEKQNANLRLQSIERNFQTMLDSRTKLLLEYRVNFLHQDTRANGGYSYRPILELFSNLFSHQGILSDNIDKIRHPNKYGLRNIKPNNKLDYLFMPNRGDINNATGEAIEKAKAIYDEQRDRNILAAIMMFHIHNEDLLHYMINLYGIFSFLETNISSVEKDIALSQSIAIPLRGLYRTFIESVSPREWTFLKEMAVVYLGNFKEERVEYQHYIRMIEAMLKERESLYQAG